MKGLLIQSDAVKALYAAPKNIRQTLLDKILQLAANPDALRNNVKALKGRPGDLRLRVGDWRIIYSMADDRVVVEDVGTRGGIYED